MTCIITKTNTYQYICYSHIFKLFNYNDETTPISRLADIF